MANKYFMKTLGPVLKSSPQPRCAARATPSQPKALSKGFPQREQIGGWHNAGRPALTSATFPPTPACTVASTVRNTGQGALLDDDDGNCAVILIYMRCGFPWGYPWVSLLVLPSVNVSLAQLVILKDVNVQNASRWRWSPSPGVLSWGGQKPRLCAGYGPTTPPQGSHPLIPSKHMLGGESVPSCSLRHKHSKHICCCLPTPEDFLVLWGDWKQAEMF